MSEPEFSEARVVVTGAAGIFGRWISEAFARQGANLFLSDFRREELHSLTRRLDSLNEGDRMCESHPTDLRDVASVEELLARVGELWASPDILINNAGIYPSERLVDMPLEHWDDVMQVNLRAPFLLTQGVARLMIENGVEGRVVNVTSGAANTTSIGSGHYSTSKAGLAMLTQAFALELAEHGIRVNALIPGFAPGSGVSELKDAYIDAMVESIPLGRTSGAEDVSEAVFYLCSERSAYMTGSTLSIDGGRAAGNMRLSAAKGI